MNTNYELQNRKTGLTLNGKCLTTLPFHAAASTAHCLPVAKSEDNCRKNAAISAHASAVGVQVGEEDRT